MESARSRTQSYSYTIDAADVITEVGKSWYVFARSNHAEHLTPDNVVGKPLWEFIASERVRRAYSRLVDRIRLYGVPAVIPFQCDSPGCRRYMRLTIGPMGAGAVRFESTLIRSRPRPHLEAMEMRVRRSSRVVPMCSVCLRLQGDDEAWRQPEDALIRMGLVEAAVPILDPALCDRCEAFLDDCTNVGVAGVRRHGDDSSNRGSAL